MKAKLTIICLLFLLYSCNLFRTTTTETKQKNDIKSETEVQKNADEKQTVNSSGNSEIGTKEVSDKLFDQMETMQEDWSTNIITYDTNKPIDSITGKPPIKSEQIINYKAEKQKNNTNKENSTVDIQEKNNLKIDLSKQLKTNSDSIAKLTDKSKLESSNKEESTNWKLWFGLGVGSVIAVWLWFKYGKRLLF